MSDYQGVRKTKRRIHPGVWVGVGLAAAVAGVYFTVDHLYHRDKYIAAAQAVKIEGAPCPLLTAQAFAAKNYKVRQQFKYADMSLGRAAGHAKCEDVASKGGKGMGVVHNCAFTSPIILEVTRKGQTLYFEPGVGKPATVIAEGDDIRCVLASNFTLN